MQKRSNLYEIPIRWFSNRFICDRVQKIGVVDLAVQLVLLLNFCYCSTLHENYFRSILVQIALYSTSVEICSAVLTHVLRAVFCFSLRDAFFWVSYIILVFFHLLPLGLSFIHSR